MIGIGDTNSDPNSFAATICYALPMIIPAWLLCTQRKHRGLLIGYLGLSVYCVLMTGSRSGLVALLAVGVFLLPRFWRINKLMIVVLLLPPPLVYPVLPIKLQNRFYSIIYPSGGGEAQDSLSGRTQGFTAGIQLWTRSPVTGFGPGGFGLAVRSGLQSHNLYGQVLGEMGTLGALTFLGIVVCMILNHLDVRRLARGQPRAFSAEVSNAVMITLVILLLKGWADHSLYRYTWLWFGAFQAIASEVHERASGLEARQSSGPACQTDLRVSINLNGSIEPPGSIPHDENGF